MRREMREFHGYMSAMRVAAAAKHAPSVRLSPDELLRWAAYASERCCFHDTRRKAVRFLESRRPACVRRDPAIEPLPTVSGLFQVDYSKMEMAIMKGMLLTPEELDYSAMDPRQEVEATEEHQEAMEALDEYTMDDDGEENPR